MRRAAAIRAWLCRLGALLAAPARGLRAVEAGRGGLRDTLWLLLAGVLCFRGEDLARAALAYPAVSLVDILLRLLQLAAAAVRDAAWVVLPAAIGLTLLAGRGRRDPSRELELAAACYVPTFVTLAAWRLLNLVAGPLPVWARQVALGLAGAWTAALCLLALWIVRARPRATARTAAEAVPPVAPEAAAPVPRTTGPGAATTVAALGLAGLLGGGLALDVAWIARNLEAVQPLARLDRAPDFRLPRVDGTPGEVTLSEHAGQVVLLDFWATWCPPCVQMLPTMHALAEHWQPRGVRFVGIHTPDETPADIATFLKEHPAPYPVVRDGDGSVNARFKVSTLPHLVLVDRDGKVVREFWGYTSRGQIEGALREAVGDP